MTPVVADASVLFKCFFPQEPLAAQAVELLQLNTAGELHIVVPDLFWPEFGNILWKAVRLGRCSLEFAAASIAEMQKQNLPTFPSHELISEAFAIATHFQRPVYDSVYVALAVSLKTYLITADERLANALASYLPVKWLGVA